MTNEVAAPKKPLYRSGTIVAIELDGKVHTAKILRVLPTGDYFVQYFDRELDTVAEDEIFRTNLNHTIDSDRITPRDVEIWKFVDKDLREQQQKTHQDTSVPQITIPENLKRYYNGTSSKNAHGYTWFMTELWKFFNRTKFQGRMEIPNLKLSKATNINRMRNRARWWAGKRMIDVRPHLFNGPLDVFVEIFLHEMCHQAVSEIDKVWETVEAGHGPHWKAWMVKVGLNPNRYDKNENVTYMKDEDKQKLADKIVQREKHYVDQTNKEVKRFNEGRAKIGFSKLKEDMVAAIKVGTDSFKEGMIVCRIAGRVNHPMYDRWAFIVKEQLGTGKYYTLPAENFYHIPDPQEDYESEKWKQSAQKVREYIAKKNEGQ